MTTEIWYEEELLAPEELVAETSKMLQGLNLDDLVREKSLNVADLKGDKKGVLERFARDKAKGALRVHAPRARQVTPEEAGALSGQPGGLLAPGKLAQGPLFLVRLGMEFDVDPSGREAGWSYKQAWCRAHLFAPTGSAPPRLLDILPQRLYEGQPTTIQVKAGPSLKVEKVMEASLGSVAADLRLGQVTPVTLGFFGEAEQKPYWELQEKEKPIRGVYHFWLLLEQPPGCTRICLSTLGEGDLRTTLFTIPVGPKVRQWERRRSVCLEDILVSEQRR
jgi:hypothetical protein